MGSEFMEPFAPFYVNSSQRNNLQTPVSLERLRYSSRSPNAQLKKCLVCTEISKDWIDQKANPDLFFIYRINYHHFRNIFSTYPFS